MLVFGMPRSGTSWLARALSQIPNLTYYREPDNYDHVAIAQRRFATLRLGVSDDDPEFADFIGKVLDGEVATDFTMQISRSPLLRRTPKPLRKLLARVSYPRRRNSDVLVKFVRVIFTIPWIASHYPSAKTLYIYRHPCGQFLSWKRLGWEPNPARLREHSSLTQGFSDAELKPLTDARSYWERAGALWGFKNELVRRQIEAIDTAAIVPFEWLCQDPVANYRTLIAALDLPWTDRVGTFLGRTNRPDDGTYSLHRRSSNEIEKWKQHLDEKEMAECRRFAESLAPNFFGDFDPKRPTLLKLPGLRN